MDNVSLSKYLKDLFAVQYLDFLNARPEPKAVRVNTLKTTLSEFENQLIRWDVAYNKSVINDSGIIIKDDVLPLSHTLEFFRGNIQYQGLSSQIPSIVLDPKPGEKVLDLAAAPGSKSTQIAAMMQNQGQLVVNDSSRSRHQPLNTNLQKAGAMIQYIYNLPGERLGKIFPEYFDKVLVDAPCTALGTLATNPEIIKWWTPEKLEKLNSVQNQLLISAVKAARTGGEIVYSTCSVAPEENELVIQSILERYPVEVAEINIKNLMHFSCGITEYKGHKINPDLRRAIRIVPHLHDMEGFFVVRLIKTGRVKPNRLSAEQDRRFTVKHDHESVKKDLESISETWGISSSYWKQRRYLRTRNRIWMFNNDVESFPDEGFTNGGILLGEEKLRMWKLTNQSVQLLSNLITRRRLELTDARLIEIFSSGKLKTDDIEDGYFVLDREGLPFASVYIDSGEMRIRLPHKFSLVL
ncbi:MAG: RsmB/NOP family class I SAM-dependent RNA methyltransferase [Calditrichaceae bacterium]